MSQPNFIDIHYDMPHFNVPKSVHYKNSLRRLRLDFNLSKMSFCLYDQTIGSNDCSNFVDNPAHINLIYPFIIIEKASCSATYTLRAKITYTLRAKCSFQIWSKKFSSKLFKLFLFCFWDYIITCINYLNTVYFSSYSNFQCL